MTVPAAPEPVDRLVGRVVAVSAGATSTIVSGHREIETAFVKHPIDGSVFVGVLGIGGDEHVYEDHGGPDMALLAYPVEHYRHWQSVGLDMPGAAAMAENLTVSGLVETDVHLGDVFEIGEVLVQVCQPRSPCYKLAARYGLRQLPVLMQDTGFTGYLLRVLREGHLAAGDSVQLVARDDHGITVAEAGRIVNVDRNDIDGARRVLAVDALGSSVRRKLDTRVAAALQLGLDTDRLFLPDAE